MLLDVAIVTDFGRYMTEQMLVKKTGDGLFECV
jgi:hypothetical protein